jgi:hypothetical protein
VITTCSPKNFDYVKRLGASQAFDYRGNAVVGEIVAALNGKKLAGAFAVAAGSATLCAEVLSASEGGEVLVFATVPGVSLDDLFRQRKAVYEDFLPGALAAGQYQAAPEPQVVGHGLRHIQSAMDAQMKGVSAAKIVVSLADR